MIEQPPFNHNGLDIALMDPPSLDTHYKTALDNWNCNTIYLLIWGYLAVLLFPLKNYPPVVNPSFGDSLTAFILAFVYGYVLTSITTLIQSIGCLLIAAIYKLTK
jgi:hypothetical protein